MAATAPRTVTAYAPAHASAVFKPHLDTPEWARKGSSGAGVCLACGVKATATIEDGPAGYAVERPGGAEARVTQHALRLLEPNPPRAIRVRLEEGAPQSRGLGISAASALSASLAAARLVGKTRTDAIRAAHRAEVTHRTGLGDVMAQATGGVVVRPAPGLPPYGSATRVPGSGVMVLLLLPGEVPTPDVLRDPERLARVAKAADEVLPALLDAPNLERVLDLGWRFTRTAELADDEVTAAVEAAQDAGHATVAHLGRTIIAYGDTDQLREILSGWGEPVAIPIDTDGAGGIQEPREPANGRTASPPP